ncbi:hypothetical protein CP97_14649 [Aurantiacibacter atlanticus]|uniref:Uncharacterized protein n=1 Tax=Aurantiacibacter atlanticus TaxID=1648404 RepID=A0A168M065_9SPHN|nr:hypothetical protein CP97_14649 [Aurantiacibacter atlanticus]
MGWHKRPSCAAFATWASAGLRHFTITACGKRGRIPAAPYSQLQNCYPVGQ